MTENGLSQETLHALLFRPFLWGSLQPKDALSGGIPVQRGLKVDGAERFVMRVRETAGPFFYGNAVVGSFATESCVTEIAK